MPKRCVLASVVLLASSLPVSAQARAGSTKIAGPGCPVSFTARREGSLIMRAGLDGHPAPAASALHMHFAPASTSRILSVSGTVHGTSAAPHVERADVIDTTGPQERTQPFHLTDSAAHAGLLDWHLTVTSVPLIRSVSLSEIRLADGTVWQESPLSHCRVEVNGLMLVDAPVSAADADHSPR